MERVYVADGKTVRAASSYGIRFLLPAFDEFAQLIKADYDAIGIPSEQCIPKTGVSMGNMQHCQIAKFEDFTLCGIPAARAIRSLSATVRSFMELFKLGACRPFLLCLAILPMAVQPLEGADTEDVYFGNGQYRYNPDNIATPYFNNYYSSPSIYANPISCGNSLYSVIDNAIFGNPSLISISDFLIEGVYVYVSGSASIPPAHTVGIWSVESGLGALRTSPNSPPGMYNADYFQDLASSPPPPQGAFYGAYPNAEPAVLVPASPELSAFVRAKVNAGADFALGCAVSQSTPDERFYVNLVVRKYLNPVVAQVQMTSPIPPLHAIVRQPVYLSATVLNDTASANISWSVIPNDGSDVAITGSTGSRTATVAFKNVGTYQVTCTAMSSMVSSKSLSIIVDPLPALADAQGPTAASPKCDTCSDGPTADQSSVDPVRFADGALEMWEDDLESTSVNGLLFRRSYSNLIAHADGELGQSWAASFAPRIIRNGASYVVRLDANRQTAFTLAGSAYQANRSGRETLTQSGSGDLVYADPIGMVLVFHNFDNGLPTRQQGRLKRVYAQGGSPQVSTYDAAGFVQDIRRMTVSTDVEERLSFAYNQSTGLLTGAQRQRIVNGGAPEVVRQVTYGYDPVVNQLQSVVVKDGSGAVLRRFHYRYYTVMEAGSSISQLKLAVGPRNYERLLGLTMPIDPLASSTTDAQLLPYADKVFQYNANRQVTQQILQMADVDGSGTYTYAYASRATLAPPVPASPGPNDWLMRFTETRPDNSVQTVFTNQSGDVLFRQTATGGAVVATADAYVYNADWRILRHITGAALQPVSGAWFDPALTDLLGHSSGNSAYVQDTIGLIESWTYYPSNGNAPGYVQSELVQLGETGVPTLLKSYTYVAHAVP